MRYVVPGWPRTVQGHSAVTPHLNRMAASGAQQYKDGVNGQPGTQAIPVKPEWIQCPAGQAQMGLSRTGDTQNAFFPNLYYARPEREFWPGAGQPVSVKSDNLMPLPAVDPRGVPSVLYQPQRRGGGSTAAGKFQIQAVPVLPRWPAVNAT
jgi:hypothetical protein